MFEAKSSVDSKWKEFLVVKDDDPEPIQKDAVTLVSDKIGYVFMITKFAVSQDSGSTWLILDIRNFESLGNRGSCRIEGVTITENGRGTMNLKCDQSPRTLSTTDFGGSWQAGD